MCILSCSLSQKNMFPMVTWNITMNLEEDLIIVNVKCNASKFKNVYKVVWSIDLVGYI